MTITKPITNNLMPFTANYQVKHGFDYANVQIMAESKDHARELFLTWYQLDPSDYPNNLNIYPDSFTLWRYPDKKHKFICKGFMSKKTHQLYYVTS